MTKNAAPLRSIMNEAIRFALNRSDLPEASRADLALRLGVSLSAMNRWMSGQTRPSPNEIKSFISLLSEREGDLSGDAIRVLAALREVHQSEIKREEYRASKTSLSHSSKLLMAIENQNQPKISTRSRKKSISAKEKVENYFDEMIDREINELKKTANSLNERLDETLKSINMTVSRLTDDGGGQS